MDMTRQPDGTLTGLLQLNGTYFRVRKWRKDESGAFVFEYDAMQPTAADQELDGYVDRCVALLGGG